MFWIFTFGQSYDLHDKYVKVEADDEEAARAIFHATRKQITEGLDQPEWRWAFSYGLDVTIQQMIDHYQLSEVPIDTPINWR
jgi:hypothetical protein